MDEDEQYVYFDVHGSQRRSEEMDPFPTRRVGFLTQEKPSYRLMNDR